MGRAIRKEPAYQSKVLRYCLLVFGPDGKTRMWVVQDDDRLYVDRNGNGDLTDDGRPVEAPGPAGAGQTTTFAAGDIPDGPRTHTKLQVSRHPATYLHPRASDPETYLAVGGGNGRYVVTGSIDNERFPTAVREANDDGARELLVVGGQSGDYPRAWIRDLDSALRATRSFFDTGEFAGGGVTWLEE